jgi:hypothetical protein
MGNCVNKNVIPETSNMPNITNTNQLSLGELYNKNKHKRYKNYKFEKRANKIIYLIMYNMREAVKKGYDGALTKNIISTDSADDINWLRNDVDRKTLISALNKKLNNKDIEVTSVWTTPNFGILYPVALMVESIVINNSKKE